MNPARPTHRQPDDPVRTTRMRVLAISALCLVGLLAVTACASRAEPVALLSSVPSASVCDTAAAPACYLTFHPAGAAGDAHFYASQPRPDALGTAVEPGASGTPTTAANPPPTHALIVIHGHPRDANKSFEAGLQATRQAGRLNDTLVVAPVFQVADALDGRCHTPGVPAARPGDLLWTCSSWLAGGLATNDPATGSFDVLDALVTELTRRWPSLNNVTIAGFSAGAQMLQHSIGFAADHPGITLRYVVSDPGTWLYFDPERAVPTKDGAPVDWPACALGGTGSSDSFNCGFTLALPTAACPTVDTWKYGVQALPTHLRRNAAVARRRYAGADIRYLEAARDDGPGHGTASRLLDKSCAAEAQGPYRLQRGLAYAAYDRAMLSMNPRRSVAIVPGCAHDVTCVFGSKVAQQALFGP